MRNINLLEILKYYKNYTLYLGSQYYVKVQLMQACLIAEYYPDQVWGPRPFHDGSELHSLHSDYT